MFFLQLKDTCVVLESRGFQIKNAFSLVVVLRQQVFSTRGESAVVIVLTRSWNHVLTKRGKSLPHRVTYLIKTRLII